MYCWRVRRLGFVGLAIAAVSCSTVAATTPDAASTEPVTTPDAAATESATESTCRAYLADGPMPAGLPALSGPGESQRTAFLTAGGKLVRIDDRYFSVWFPLSYFRAERPLVVYDLHGTAGYPEAEWTDWNGAFDREGVAMIALYWEGGTQSATSDVSVYDRLKRARDEVAKACPMTTAKHALLGFSVGSALSYAVMIRDRADRKLFSSQLANSGSAWSPLATGMSVMHPTVEEARGSPSAYASGRAFLYCGAKDMDHGWSMCDEVATAEQFVREHGGIAKLFRDPTGGHASMPKNGAAVGEALSFLRE